MVKQTARPAPDDLVRRHAQPGLSLIAVLHAIQDEAGFVPPAAIIPLARALNLSRAEVQGVISYYPHFRLTPPAALTIQLCRAEACRGMGGEALAQHIETRTGCQFTQHGHHNPPDPAQAAQAGHPANAALALEPVYCLGLCATAPALTLNGTVHARVTPEKFDALFAAAAGETGQENAP